MRRPERLALLLALVACGCTPEGDGRLRGNAQIQDPCQELGDALASGIETDEDIRLIFDCANKDGSFDSFVPLMDALQHSVLLNGSTTPMNLWLDIVEQLREDTADRRTSLSTLEVEALLDETITLLNEPWVYDAVGLTGDLLACGAVEGLIPVTGDLAEELVTSSTYDIFLDSAATLLCPDLEQQQQCVGDVQQFYLGIRTAIDARGTSGEVLPTGEDLASALDAMFAVSGSNEAANQSINLALARGLARLGDGDFLEKTVAKWLPVLYGDDPSTATALEGYDSFNTNLSALYGVTSKLGDPDFLEAFAAGVGALGPLINQYYVWSARNLEGEGVAVVTGSCEPGSGAGETSFERENPAYFGLDQVLRLVKALDVPYVGSACQTEIVENVLESLGMYLELSGTDNLATLILEVFAQLPTSVVQSATDAGSLSTEAIGFFNDTCGTSLTLNDYEALQATVHVDTAIGPMLELLAAVQRAEAPGDAVTMDTLKDLLVALYDTHMLCEAQPWLNATSPEDISLDGLLPFMPSGDDSTTERPYHQSITVPLLRAVIRLQGSTAEIMIPPLAAALADNEQALGDALTGLGVLGYEAQHSTGDPALHQLDEIVEGLADQDQEAKAVEGIARAFEDPLVLSGVLETLALEQLQEALSTPYPDVSSPTAIEFMAETLQSGALQSLLGQVRRVLEAAREQIDNSEAE